MLFGLAPPRRSLLRWLVLLSPLSCSGGCDRPPTPAPGELRAPEARTAPSEALDADAGAGRTGADRVEADADAAAEIAAGPYTGPYFTVTSGSAGIYTAPSADRSRKLGYARAGGHVPVLAGSVPGENCDAGWLRLLDGGFICSAEGSLDPNDPRVRLAMRTPDLSAVLPYPYARNAHNGTPLYSSVPSRDQIAQYEPYLAAAAAPSAAATATGALAWWQRKELPLSEVRLTQLADESDGLLGRRMVKGFYIAVDTEFEWSDRSWYKTTKGLIAPKDRFVAVDGATFRGVDLDPEHALPVAWVYGSRDSRPTYQLDEAGKAKPSGSIERLTPIYLEGEPVKAEGHEYVRARAGFWVRSDQVRIARVPPLPPNLEDNEHWIHVDLPSQTLVAMSGATPVYATLVSSGRESEDEDRDHRTPPGEYTIREKHLTNTMDGDGTAAGDLPYSIEDVPYVMYFQGSYALHGAFWHRNFGSRMSHGCINLAPLDAKWLFLFTGPSVREGWHGAWTGNGQAGSRVVIDGPSRGATARR